MSVPGKYKFLCPGNMNFLCARNINWKGSANDKCNCRYPIMQELIHYTSLFLGIGLEVGFKNRMNMNIFVVLLEPTLQNVDWYLELILFNTILKSIDNDINFSVWDNLYDDLLTNAYDNRITTERAIGSRGKMNIKFSAFHASIKMPGNLSKGSRKSIFIEFDIPKGEGINFYHFTPNKVKIIVHVKYIHLSPSS